MMMMMMMMMIVIVVVTICIVIIILFLFYLTYSYCYRYSHYIILKNGLLGSLLDPWFVGVPPIRGQLEVSWISGKGSIGVRKCMSSGVVVNAACLTRPRRARRRSPAAAAESAKLDCEGRSCTASVPPMDSFCCHNMKLQELNVLMWNMKCFKTLCGVQCSRVVSSWWSSPPRSLLDPYRGRIIRGTILVRASQGVWYRDGISVCHLFAKWTAKTTSVLWSSCHQSTCKTITITGHDVAGT